MRRFPILVLAVGATTLSALSSDIDRSITRSIRAGDITRPALSRNFCSTSAALKGWPSEPRLNSSLWRKVRPSVVSITTSPE